jgi:hypothetical protein
MDEYCKHLPAGYLDTLTVSRLLKFYPLMLQDSINPLLLVATAQQGLSMHGLP